MTQTAFRHQLGDDLLSQRLGIGNGLTCPLLSVGLLDLGKLLGLAQNLGGLIEDRGAMFIGLGGDAVGGGLGLGGQSGYKFVGLGLFRCHQFVGLSLRLFELCFGVGLQGRGLLLGSLQDVGRGRTGGLQHAGGFLAKQLDGPVFVECGVGRRWRRNFGDIVGTRRRVTIDGSLHQFEFEILDLVPEVLNLALQLLDPLVGRRSGLEFAKARIFLLVFKGRGEPAQVPANRILVIASKRRRKHRSSDLGWSKLLITLHCHTAMLRLQRTGVLDRRQVDRSRQHAVATATDTRGRAGLLSSGV